MFYGFTYASTAKLDVRITAGGHSHTSYIDWSVKENVFDTYKNKHIFLNRIRGGLIAGLHHGLKKFLL